MTAFNIDEKRVSQLAAVELLVGLGYETLARDRVKEERGGRLEDVVLEGVLRAQLREINRIQYKKNEYLFSEENIQEAVRQIKNVKFDGLQQTNENILRLLLGGATVQQTVEGDTKSFQLRYIDWVNPHRNKFHVVMEYTVECMRSRERVRPDVVLFVNGIPFCVIECKGPYEDVEQGISQMLRNQGIEYIPQLFSYAQLLISTNKNEAKYATVGTALKFWGLWREAALDEGGAEHGTLTQLVAGRLVTEQDKLLYALCRPERLLELAQRYTLFDNKQKKIARYQQYFVVKEIIEQVRELGVEGRREGGVVWHTQGSGKSLTMVLLAHNLAMDMHLPSVRIVLVSDRVDLDKQLKNTFVACGKEAKRATSAKKLLEGIAAQDACIITTLVHKFDRAYNIKRYHDESPNIFVLVDEGHRTQFGNLAGQMRKMFPNACYLGFTGTPVMAKEKNIFVKFGRLIQPTYTMRQAVEDKSVVPLFYEGRRVEMTQNEASMDTWFARHTQGLNEDQKSDLKRKYARANMLTTAEPFINMVAYDVSFHFKATYQGTGFKGQLVAPNKATAIKYLHKFNELGLVSAAVLISAPDEREGYEEIEDDAPDDIHRFWQKMMNRYGTEGSYNDLLISEYKTQDEPEIIIVVDKLLTGFDAPRNSVLYLTRKLTGHTLLQAIARVNRLYPGKDYGLIMDYVNLLGELDAALSTYDALENFDESDLYGILTSMAEEIKHLPQHHSLLWDLFKEIKNKGDEEAYEQLLGDDERRDEFYARLLAYGKALATAFASPRFLESIDDETLTRYKRDLQKFMLLRQAVKQRYADEVDFKEYEPKIKKLLDTHIYADEVTTIYDKQEVFEGYASRVQSPLATYHARPSKAAQADTITYNLIKRAQVKLHEDPAFFSAFSELVRQAINAYRDGRISDEEYLDQAKGLEKSFTQNKRDDIPPSLKGRTDVYPFYGAVFSSVKDAKGEEEASKHTEAFAQFAMAIASIVKEHWKVDFAYDQVAQNRVQGEIDDYYFDVLKPQHTMSLDLNILDSITRAVLEIITHKLT